MVSLAVVGLAGDGCALLSDCFESQPASTAAVTKRSAMRFTISPRVDWSYSLVPDGLLESQTLAVSVSSAIERQTSLLSESALSRPSRGIYLAPQACAQARRKTSVLLRCLLRGDDADELPLASIRPLKRSGYSGSLRSASRSNRVPSVFPLIRTKQSHIPLARDRTPGHTDETFLPMHAIFTDRPPPRCRHVDALACLSGVRCGVRCGMSPITRAATRRRKNDARLKHFLQFDYA